MKKNPLGAALSRARGAKASKTSATVKPDEDKPTKFKNPDYIQTTVYLPRTLHKPVKVALIEDELEFSDLVERLLSDWLASRKK